MLAVAASRFDHMDGPQYAGSRKAGNSCPHHWENDAEIGATAKCRPNIPNGAPGYSGMIGTDSVLATFRSLAAQPDEQINLADGALAIARLHYPDLDVARRLVQLDSMAERAAAGLPDAAPHDRARALARWLFVNQGFRGNELNYYDPRNSFLNEVLDRRLGLPITLSLLFIAIARRCGVPAFGVGLPGHFVIGVETGEDSLYLDPFGGRDLSLFEMTGIASRAIGQPVKVDRLLKPAPNRTILFRMLQNLKAIYLSRQSYDMAFRMLDLILILEPASIGDLREHGAIAFRRGEISVARADFQRYLAGAPARGTRDVRRWLTAMEN